MLVLLNLPYHKVKGSLLKTQGWCPSTSLFWWPFTWPCFLTKYIKSGLLQITIIMENKIDQRSIPILNWLHIYLLHCCWEKSHFTTVQWARKFKKVQTKKLVKSNKSISRKKIVTKFHFLQFQKWTKYQFFEEGKLSKMQFRE